MIPLITAVAGVLSALSSISSLSSSSAADPDPPSTSAASGASFSDALKTAISQLDSAISSANEKAQAFASGNSNVSLSDVMVSLEQANLALQAAANVRDKIVAAYSNVMNMPV